jgi:demethylmenaquinone methyltransferase / 2-methoxy-6-polyprenyl-1,4-benzoquinol methylase
VARSSQRPQRFRLSPNWRADLCQSELDNLTYDVIRERLVHCEPDCSLGKLESREPVTYLIDDLRTEREDAQMTLRCREAEQGFLLVPERRHPIAGALLGVRHDLQCQSPDALECRPAGGVQAFEVVVNHSHAANNRTPVSGAWQAVGVPDADSAGIDGAGSTRATLDKRHGEIAAMFDRVAARYDLANDVLSLGQDRAWRREVVQAVAPRPGQLILDVAAGTGTSSEPFVERGATVIPTDLSLGMLLIGKQRRPGLSFVAADALQLPYADSSFDAVTISFGLRNVEDTAAALREMRRVIKPGGALVVCEFSTPTWPPFRTLYSNYLVAALPRIATLVSSNPAAYEYLAESIQAWPDQQGLATVIARCGWRDVEWRNLSGGIVALHRARS